MIKCESLLYVFYLKWTLAIEITDIQIDGFPMPELKSLNYPSYKSGVFEACQFLLRP